MKVLYTSTLIFIKRVYALLFFWNIFSGFEYLTIYLVILLSLYCISTAYQAKLSRTYSESIQLSWHHFLSTCRYHLTELIHPPPLLAAAADSPLPYRICLLALSFDRQRPEEQKKCRKPVQKTQQHISGATSESKYGSSNETTSLEFEPLTCRYFSIGATTLTPRTKYRL